METQVLDATQTDVAQPQTNTQVATVPKTVSRLTLIRVLSQLQKVIKAASPLIPILENVLATKSEDGNWVLAAYNMTHRLLVRTTVSVPITVTGSRPELAGGVFCIPAAILLDTAKLSKGDVALEFNTDSISLKVTFNDCVSYKIACEYEPIVDAPFPNQVLVADATDFEIDFSVVKRATQFVGKDQLRPGMCHVYLSFDENGYCGTAATNGSIVFKHGTLADDCVFATSKCIDILPDGVHKTSIIDAGLTRYMMVTFDCFQFFVVVSTDREDCLATYTAVKNFQVKRAEQAFLMLDVKHIRQIKPLVFYGNSVSKTFDMMVNDGEVTCTAVNEDFGTECEVSLYDVAESMGRTLVRVSHDQFTAALKVCLIDADQVYVSFGMSEQPISFQAGDTMVAVMPHRIPTTYSATSTDEIEDADVVEVSEPTQTEPQAE